MFTLDSLSEEMKKMLVIADADGALRMLMTYDNHPIPSHPSTYSIEDDLS